MIFEHDQIDFCAADDLNTEVKIEFIDEKTLRFICLSPRYWVDFDLPFTGDDRDAIGEVVAALRSAAWSQVHGWRVTSVKFRRSIGDGMTPLLRFTTRNKFTSHVYTLLPDEKTGITLEDKVVY